MRLRLQGLCRRVGTRTLFAGLSFTIGEGEIVGIAAPSGAGKTMLLRGIAGLDRLDDGKMWLDDCAPNVFGWPHWRSKIIYVSQHPPKLRGSAQDWLKSIRSLGTHSGRVLRDPIEIGREWNLDPGVWNRPFFELSGGEMQRVFLLVALSQDPAVLLLDEPTSAVDDETQNLIEESLCGRTAIWVSHDAGQLARVAQHRIELCQ